MGNIVTLSMIEMSTQKSGNHSQGSRKIYWKDEITFYNTVIITEANEHLRHRIDDR